MANLVLIRLIRSDGKSFILGTGAWRILSDGLKGIDFPNFSVYSDKNGVGDGALLSGKRIDDRDVQIKCKSIEPQANASIRDATIAFFNPKHSFKIYITYQGVTKWIDTSEAKIMFIYGSSDPWYSLRMHDTDNPNVKMFVSDTKPHTVRIMDFDEATMQEMGTFVSEAIP